MVLLSMARYLGRAFCFLLLFGCSFFVNADTVLHLSDKSQRNNFSDFVSVYVDKTHDLPFQQVITQGFEVLPGTSSYGNLDEPVWSKVVIHNDTNRKHWYLQHIFPLTKELRLYIPEKSGEFAEQVLHITDSTLERDVPESLMTFGIDIEPGSTQTIYLRHLTPTLISYQFKIFSDSELIISDRIHTFYQAFFYAFLLIIAMINVLLSFSSGAKRYLYVSFFCVGMAIAYGSYEGVLQALSGWKIGEYRLLILIATAGAAFISLLNYIRYITPSLLPTKSLKLATVVLVTIWLILPFLSFSASLMPHRLFVLAYIVTTLFALFLTLIGVKNGDIKSRHFLITMLLFAIGFVLQGAHRLGLVEDFAGVTESVRLAIVVLAFSMTLTLMDYIKSLRELIDLGNTKFRNVFDNMQDAMAVLDDKYRVLEINRAALLLEGGDHNDFIGRSIFDDNLLSKSSGNREKLSAAMALASKGEQSQIELQMSFANQEMHLFNVSVIPYLREGSDKYNILLSGRDLTESLQHQARMTAISAVLSESTGEKFFEELAIKLYELTGQEFVMIASVDLDANSATTHAYIVDGAIQKNISYSLEGTPCDQVIGDGVCTYNEGVAELFSDDLFLAEASIKSYTGIPLRSSDGKALGLIALLSRSSTKGQDLEEILSIFSLRAAAEMERENNQKNLIETEQKLSLHIDNTPLGVLEVDNDNIVLEWNKAAEAIFGYSKEEVIGRDANDTAFSSLTAQQFGLLLLNRRQDGRNIFAHKHKDGSEIYCEWFVTPLIDKNQELGYAAMFEDVTQQKKMISALVRKEQEQSDILNSMADAAITINEKGQVLSFNQAAEKIFEYTEGEIVGKSVNLLMPETIASKHDHYIEHYLKTGEAQIIGVGREVEGVTKSGRVFPMRLTISELPALESGVRRFIGTCHDQTTLKQKEQQLLQSQKMESLGKLTGGIAHDFNNILGIITGYTGLLTATAELDESEEGYIDEINRATERGSTLTKKLLSLSKVKPLDSTSIALNKAVEGMKDVIVRTMTPRIHVTLDMDSQTSAIKVDLNSFEDTLLNLCINAMHAMQDEGQLSISTRSDVLVSETQASGSGAKPGLYHVLIVKDTGEGIAKETLSKVFDPFFSTKGEKGTGLGLSQAYGFMKQSEGFIELDSLVGVGTEFRLYFPKPEEQSVGDQDKRNSEDLSELSGSESLLVVDDELHMQKTTAALLEKAGYQVMATGTPKRAMELVREKDFDLILSDVVMPEMDGYELAEELHKLKPEANIQLMSGYLSEAVKQKVTDKGLNILPKPFSYKDLLYFVRSSIDERTERT